MVSVLPDFTAQGMAMKTHGLYFGYKRDNIRSFHWVGIAGLEPEVLRTVLSWAETKRHDGSSQFVDLRRLELFEWKRVYVSDGLDFAEKLPRDEETDPQTEIQHFAHNFLASLNYRFL
jgi:hypothetical protein